MMKIYFFLVAFVSLLLGACTPEPVGTSFITVSPDGQFMRYGKPYYYVGANFWYGAILGSEGEGGNRKRLHKELDFLKSIGVDNLRVLVGADGENGVKTRVEPSLQTAPGVYNDTILDGLDYFMNELRRRDMTAVLYLNNSWEWSGGYSMYLQWSGHGKAVIPAVDGWPAYNNYVKQFHQSDSAKVLFANYVKDIVTRTNRYNKIKYVDDPTLMSWQIGNEPRAFSDENKEAFARWMTDVAAQIKSLDPNHLVSSGSEGAWGCEGDITLYEKIHSDPNIDYLNNLLMLKGKETFMQTKVMSLYFILLSSGILLYMYEYTLNSSFTFRLIAYSVLFLWIALNWFVLRPVMIRKNRRRMDCLIRQIEKIKSQVDEF